MICPFCGQPVLKSPNMRMQSRWMEQLLSDHALSCLCRTSREELERLYSTLEIRLSEIVREYFPEATNRQEIYAEIDKLDRDDPLRAEVALRLNYLTRVRERIKEMPLVEDVKEEMVEMYKKLQTDNRRGKAQSMKDWLIGSG